MEECLSEHVILIGTFSCDGMALIIIQLPEFFHLIIITEQVQKISHGRHKGIELVQ
jgi:hypothetical protein